MGAPSIGWFLGRASTPSTAKGTLPPTDELYFYVDDTDNSFKQIDSNGVVTDLSDVDIREHLIVRKTADQIVNNDMTLVNDTHLFLSLKANTTYVVKGTWMMDIHDLAIVFNAQDGLTISSLIIHGLNVEEAEQTTTVALDVIANFTVNEIIGVPFSGTVVTTAAGTLAIKWAQPASNPFDSTMKAGSYMEAIAV